MGDEKYLLILVKLLVAVLFFADFVKGSENCNNFVFCS
jgi:hypothetical protein